jgi:oxalate decarboxylase/phosphoglucose isomerase-like protein (cupin superfamily)
MDRFGDCYISYNDDVETLRYDWGEIRLLGEERISGGATMTLGAVTLYPGQGHERHNHPNADEYIYVVSGTGEQMLDDNPAVMVKPGANIYIPRGVFHSTVNKGSEAMQLIVVYAPAGEENVLRSLPGVEIVPPVNS